MQMSIDNYLDENIKNILRIEFFDKIDSTNTHCKRLAASGEADGYVAIAHSQTEGRGRLGRSFYSPKDTGLYMSILLRPDKMAPDHALRFTQLAAVSVAEAIEAILSLLPDDALEHIPEQEREQGAEQRKERARAEAISIKWVNDILIEGKKVAGILVEGACTGASFSAPFHGSSAGYTNEALLEYAIVGIGVNVFEPEGGFPAEIKDTASSIFEKRDVYQDTADTIFEKLAAEIINRFYSNLLYKPFQYILNKYAELCHDFPNVTHNRLKT